jgi:lysophospholipase L1-like esterase
MNKIKTIIINLLILFVGFLLLELFFGGWFSDNNQIRSLNIIRDQTMNFTTDLYSATEIDIKYSRDKYGLRGKKTLNSPEKIDILTIGGSTTDQRYITEGKTWQDLLENSFKKDGKEVLISNAGVDGQSTFGHIKNFEIWLPEIPNLKPKYILFYIGVNDFYLLSKSRYDDLNDKSWKTKIKNNSALYSLLRTAEGIWTSYKVKVGHQKINIKEIEYTNKGCAERKVYELFKKNLNDFENRVSALVKFSKGLNSTPIFVTQPSYKYKFDNDGNILGTATIERIDNYPYNGVDYYHLLTMINESIRNVADDKVLVVELTSLPIWKDGDFYDYFHNTPQGSERVAEEIYKQIKNSVK